MSHDTCHVTKHIKKHIRGLISQETLSGLVDIGIPRKVRTERDFCPSVPSHLSVRDPTMWLLNGAGLSLAVALANDICSASAFTESASALM